MKGRTNHFCWTVKSQRHTRGTFMSVLSNKSFSHYRCAEGTLPFSTVAQRLYIGGKTNGRKNICRTVKSQRHTRGTFMSVLSNKSFSHYRCAEGTLPFSTVAQRLYIGGKTNGRKNICRTVKSQRHTRGTFMSVLSNKSFSHYRCAEGTLPFSTVAQRLYIGGKTNGRKINRGNGADYGGKIRL